MPHVKFSPLCLCALLTACGAPALTADVSTAQAALISPLPTFKVCETSPYSGPEPEGFPTRREALWSRQGYYHSAQDVVATAGGDANSNAWFQYGVVRHPILAQRIDLSVDICSGYASLGEERTWAEGHTLHRFPAQVSPQDNRFPALDVGRYTLIHRSIADGSQAASRLFVLPRGTHIVVFDIDGTLTISNHEFVQQVLDNDYVPQAFADATAATKAWSDKGYVLVYLSGRPHAASDMTRAWINGQHFAKGILHLSYMNTDLRPTDEGVGTFKRSYLKYLQGLGLIIDYAYGNETTDVYAYKSAGLDNAHIFMLGEKAGYDGTQPLPHGYSKNLSFIANQPPAQQPFLWPQPQPQASVVSGAAD